MAVLELRGSIRAGVGLETYAAGARAADLCLMVLATAVAWSRWSSDPTARQMSGWVTGYLPWALPLVLAWFAVLQAADAYDTERVGDAAHELRAVVAGTGVVAAGAAILSFLTRSYASRATYAITFGLGIVLLLVSHLVVRRLLRSAHSRGLYMRPVVAVGARAPITTLVAELERSTSAGLQVVAACVPEEEAWDPIGNVRWVLPTSALHEVVADTGAQHVFLLSGAGESPRHIRRIAWSLEGTEAKLAVVPHLTDIARGRIRPRPVAGLPLIELDQPELSGLQAMLKRSLDLVLAALGLLLLSPLLVTVALLVRREDGGPALFRQVRVGREGRTFECLKFRSMVVDADRHLEALRSANEGHGVLFKLREDPRITRIGRVLRTYSLDEFPQLLNVLRGDMSLVGPRPPLPAEVSQYHPDMNRRLKVRPGMTGLWQVSGRSDLTAEESERLDLYYVDNWSISQDAVILWKTVRVVLTGSGAY
ncbi:sugar transferase [Nocardioides mesophilus]|uniref:Sugar transferase n=1 Tax=Nocardioides mesophilus TaxID=433659 RepID=A0A7G9REC8_9ACTN|nr:sugar transferase [Nocardioides mesophilus]QNN53953.1 sugar transferase [Nocardioides mesophilus]